jgi:hypothetical protein
LRRTGCRREEKTGHGFRSTSRTILDDVLQKRPDSIEHQPALATRDPNGLAYKRPSHSPERRKIRQLDWLKNGPKMITFK